MRHGGLQEIIDTGQCPGIVGTRDLFGIGKDFRDDRTGKVIDTYPKWEKAGYRPLDISRDIKKESVKEKVARKIWKIKRQGRQKTLTESLM